MLIGQWVDKGSTISLRNEPLHRRSAASEEAATEEAKKQGGAGRGLGRWKKITIYVWVFASSVLPFQLSEHCVGVCMWTRAHPVPLLLSDKNLHLSGENASAKISIVFFFSFFFLGRKEPCFSWMTMHFGITLRDLKEVYEPKGLKNWLSSRRSK